MTADTRLRLTYIANDYVLSLLGMIAFGCARYAYIPAEGSTVSLWAWMFFDSHVLEAILLIPLLTVCISAVLGYYNDVVSRSRLDDLRMSLTCGVAGTLAVYFVAMINDYIPGRASSYFLLLYLLLCLTVPVYLGRTVITLVQRRHLRQAGGSYRALIVADDEAARHLTRRLAPTVKGGIAAFHVCGSVSPGGDVAAAAKRLHAQAIIVGRHPDGLEATVELISRLYALNVNIYLPLDIYSLIASRTRITNVVGEPLINISNANLSPATVNLKRLGDIAVSALALLLLSPVYAAVAVAIRRSSPGPVFYRQERVGYHKRKFNIIKFRTMYTDAEASGPALSSDGDPRITPVGAILRKYRLDELPQFWNVLRGDMSLVGPRPEREYYVRQIVERVPHYSLVHQVRPGITSWGMVKYGYASTVEQMIERVPYDLLYIENVSLGVDLKILFHTVNTVISGKGV